MPRRLGILPLMLIFQIFLCLIRIKQLKPGVNYFKKILGEISVSFDFFS